MSATFRPSPSLRDLGYRFTRRGSAFEWRHPADSLPSDVDCTSMTGLELEHEVCRALGIFAFAPPAALTQGSQQ